MKLASRSLLAGVIAVVALTASPLYATPISIGQTVVPTGLVEPVTPVTVLATAGGPFSFDSGALTGNWAEYVVVDPFGFFCAQCLDFVIQFDVDATSTESIRRAGLLPFGNFLTDVNYLLGAGVVTPGEVSDGTIGTVSFFFTLVNQGVPGQQPVGPGQTSAVLIIATNATAYRTAGSLGFDAIGAAGVHPVPVITGVLTPAPVPEPATLTLLGTGLLAVARRRVRGRTK